MATKERYQNPVVGDTLNLRLLTYNLFDFADVDEIEKVDVYFLDENNKTKENPDGRRLVQSFSGASVTHEDVGTYLLSIDMPSPTYTIGLYLDVWTIKARADQPSHTVAQPFEIYPDQWYTSPVPIVHDFRFYFRPNQFRKGSRQYIMVEIVPNVPTGNDLQRYYQNLATVSSLNVSIEQASGDNVPEEQDLRTVVENEPVQHREKRFGYYQLDTTDMNCGIYNIWFTLDFGNNRYLSEKMQFQIYD